MNLSSMKYIKLRKPKNKSFKGCQDFEDTGKIRCLCQNGSRHNNKKPRYRTLHINYETVLGICQSYKVTCLTNLPTLCLQRTNRNSAAMVEMSESELVKRETSRPRALVPSSGFNLNIRRFRILNITEMLDDKQHLV